MTSIERQLFQQLRDAISSKLRNRHPDIEQDTRLWKRKEIELFQKELHDKVQGRISEKWFYTHLKADHNSLPRIDMLDLLSRYAGYADWSAFKKAFSGKTYLKGNRLLAGLMILITIATVSLIAASRPPRIEFCFMDLYSQQVIPAEQLQVTWVRTGETPRFMSVNERGCVCFKSRDNLIKLEVASPYYKNQTVIRKMEGKQTSEVISLRTDDYARAIHFFSQPDQKEWSRCRSFLSGVFRKNARIYQYNEDGTDAVDIYNQEEFIDKLTSPTRSLMNLEIIEVAYEDNKIAVLRFKEKSHGQ